MAESVSTVFNKLSETFSAQDVIREALKNARDKANLSVRTAQRTLSTLHTATDLQAQATKVGDLLKTTGEPLKAIESALPDEAGAFHRYADIWHQQLQMASMVAVVLGFVKNGTLANVDNVKEMIGADIQLPIEDYLVGVCNAVNELARLSLNRVIQNDFDMPAKCHEFASNVFEGFKELNLRNDFLRKRYDGMKYDVKKMEDILYDLSIRGLRNGTKRKSPVQDTPVKKTKVEGETKTDGKAKVDGEQTTAGEDRRAGETKSNGDTTTGGEAKAAGKTNAGGETAASKDAKEAPMDTTA